MAYTFKHGERPLDDFTIQRAVGSGGFGEVYYAVSDGGREVALKYLKSNPQVELRGVSHCINLKSPHLVSIFDVKKNADDEYFIVMEYCSGPSLRDLLIAEPNGFGPEKAAFFLREIGKGLSYLHDRGIVHRDLKPGNIFYDDGYVKIGDYGLSKFISVSRHSAQTASIGTVHYMAPEIGSGHYSRGVDIYALGVILYEMLMGKVPFEGSTMAEVLMKHLTAQPELDQLPHPFGDVIRKALQKDPANRYQTVDEMTSELLEVENIARSLAGFSTKSLEGAVRRGGADAAPSPVPSPNPPPPGMAPFAKPVGEFQRRDIPAGAGRPLPPRLAKTIDHRAHKIEQRMAKLAGERPRKAPPPLPVVPTPPSTFEGPAMHRRRALPVLITLGLAITLGLIAGNGLDSEEAGASAGLLTVLMTLGITLSRRAVGWFDVPYGKNWASRIIHAGACAPLLAIGTIPLFESHTERGLPVWLGLVVVAILADWRSQFESGAKGNLCIWSAVWVAFGALVATAAAGMITDSDLDGFGLVVAGVAGITALVAQATGGRNPTGAIPRAIHDMSGASPGVVGSAGMMAAAPAPRGVTSPEAAASSPPTADSSSNALRCAPSIARLRRWDVTRGFWGVFAFLLAGGAIITFFLFYMGEYPPAERTGILVGSFACASAMLFAARRTTPLKRPGIWREWLRPLLITVALFGCGSLAAVLNRHGSALDGDLQAVTTAGLVMSMLLLIVVNLVGRGALPVVAFDTDADVEGNRRHLALRVFWGVLSFLLLSGGVLTGLLAAMGKFDREGDRTGISVGCAACLSVMLFTLRKTKQRSRPGFLREWLGPFLTTIAVFGLGSLGVVARQWDALHREVQALTAAGLTVSFLLLVVSLLLRRKPKAPPPFVIGDRMECRADGPIETPGPQPVELTIHGE